MIISILIYNHWLGHLCIIGIIIRTDIIFYDINGRVVMNPVSWEGSYNHHLYDPNDTKNADDGTYIVDHSIYDPTNEGIISSYSYDPNQWREYHIISYRYCILMIPLLSEGSYYSWNTRSTGVINNYYELMYISYSYSYRSRYFILTMILPKNVLPNSFWRRFLHSKQNK